MSEQSKIWDHFQNEGVDSFSLSQGRLEFLCRQVSPGLRVLNIGVGNGAFEKMAIAKGIEVWSLDPSDRAVNRIREAFNMGSKAQVGYCQSMPYPDCTFDVVVMSEVLEHLDDEVLKMTLSEVVRVLRPEGCFLGTVPARERLEDSLVICPQCGTGFHRWGHVRNFTVDNLIDQLQSNFRVVKVVEMFFIDWELVGWWRRLQGLVKKFLSWRGIGTYGTSRSIYFSAKKLG